MKTNWSHIIFLIPEQGQDVLSEVGFHMQSLEAIPV
ncbi:hypothetical protein VST7929_01206 [Vibrio stylophorae]|uniref:Glyoxalase n=1 Tax=Vibrio stylophorae TaxID=659351 RepID=A0ABN8DTV4_9VIBR|nr:hypothetical protein VST7929_01206 [Vibrio stylophorae]